LDILIIASNPRDWQLHIPGVEVVSARTYLINPAYSERRGTKVFNLARSYRYQSMGYYVSLLAEARGHRPLPNIATIQDLKSQTMTRFVSEELDELIQTSLAPIKSKEFVLSIYFGRNLAKRHQQLSRELFNLYPAPLLRARFVHQRAWQLQSINPIAANEIPAEHYNFVIEAATDYFAGKRARTRRRAHPRFDLAILANPDEENAPSDARAIKKFVKAAEALGMSADVIGKDDYGYLAEYDALFLRETTLVSNHTYRFARRAQTEGLVVIDDPDSILRCSNKVYLAELLARHEIPAPKTIMVTRSNMDRVVAELGLPCVLKQPDSAFSQGVVKVDTVDDYFVRTAQLLDRSDLIVAQAFVPTEYDWRVGVLDGKALYVCKYFMARRHWQVVKRDQRGRAQEGEHVTMAVEDAPPELVRLALKVANLIGDGLYGVDLKQLGKRFFVVEINDNPSIDAGVEDQVLGDGLYRTIMANFLQRLEARTRGE